jgi:hypothetical protein
MKNPLECYIGTTPENKESHSVPGKRLKVHECDVIKPTDTQGDQNNLQVILPYY